MGRAPCCDKSKVKRGPWSPEEDALLKSFIEAHGTGGNWIALPRKAGLNRCGKSCRLRWLNYLRPDIRHGGFTQEEDYIKRLLIRHDDTFLYRWSVIASKLPGRTDNDIKNYWNTKLKKKTTAGEVPGLEPTSAQPNPAVLFTGPKPEPIAYDNGYYSLASSLPYSSAVGVNMNSWDNKDPAQQNWDPLHDQFFHGVSDRHETSGQSEQLPPPSSRCSSIGGGGSGEEAEEDDIDDFWLRLLVGQSTFFGGDSQEVHCETKKINGFDSVLDYSVYPSFY
ncbi:hypothetical protein V2J09_003281 [Rumex salicifolius]